MPLRVMFADMNAYFASVEQQECPQLRGRPVVIVPVLAESTGCIAVSREAKRLGIKGGTHVTVARQMCRDLRVVKARPQVYVAYHHRIRKAIETCLPIGARESIDEFWCPLSDLEREPEPAIALARQVKQAIKERVGQYITCSIGLAPNRFLGKVASDMQKPDGLTVITENDLPHKLHSLMLEDFPGIAKRMHARLQHHGIETAEQLCAASRKQLIKVWGGVVGEYWWHWLRGDQTHSPPTRRQTIGHSHVLPPWLRTNDGAKSILNKLIHRAALRLRKERYWARSMEIYIAYTYHEEGWRTDVPLGMCQDTLTMIQAMEAVWPFRPAMARPTQVAITLHGLIPDAYATLPLFPEERQRVQLARVMDAINERLGHNMVYVAGLASSKEEAPTRISFNQLPDEDDPDFEDAPTREIICGAGSPSRGTTSRTSRSPSSKGFAGRNPTAVWPD